MIDTTGKVEVGRQLAGQQSEMVNKEIRAVAITDTGIFTDSNKTAQFVSAKKQIEVAVDKKEPSDEKAKELLVV